MKKHIITFGAKNFPHITSLTALPMTRQSDKSEEPFHQNMRSILYLILLGCFAASPAYSQSDTGSQKPNIVLFLVDDMGWRDSSAFGSTYYETPEMESLARESMVFTQAYAQPLCSPCRASILSGQHSARHGILTASGHIAPAKEDTSPYKKHNPNSRWTMPQSKNYLDPEIENLAEILGKAGYQTGHYGKWHIGSTLPHRPEGQGFHESWQAAPDPGPPSYFSPYGVTPEGEPGGRTRVGNITDGPDGEYITDRLTDEAIAFIEQNRDRPFFLNLWQYGVHGPWGHKPEYTAEFAKKTDPQGLQANPIMASMLQSVDESLGRVLDTLESLDLADNTIFVFYSDNGGNVHSNRKNDPKMAKVGPGHSRYAALQDWRRWAGDHVPTSNAPLRDGKASIYEGGTRVPLMVRWPGHIEAATTTEARVSSVDLFPTLLAAAGADLPAGQPVDGESFLPILKGRKPSLDRDSQFIWFPYRGSSIHKGDWKLVRHYVNEDPGLAHELYRLSDDLGESKDLASEHPEKVAELSQLMDQYLKDTGALPPLENPNFQQAKPGQSNPDNTTRGLVPKNCSMELRKGALVVNADSDKSFLGTAQVKFAGPLKVKLRIRGSEGGKVSLAWREKGSTEIKALDSSASLIQQSNEEWQAIELTIPTKAKIEIVRLMLSIGDGSVEIGSYSIQGADGEVDWDFIGSR
jgi:arylsulfatase A-like enzyme